MVRRQHIKQCLKSSITRTLQARHHQPMLLSLRTLVIVPVNPVLNFFRHRSHLSLFRLKPGLSWNICLLKSALILSLTTSAERTRNALPRSLPLEGSTSMDFPILAFFTGRGPFQASRALSAFELFLSRAAVVPSI